MKIVIPDDVTRAFTESAETDRLRRLGELEIHTSRAASTDELDERIRAADIVLTFRPAFTRFEAASIRQCPQLKMICVAGTGVEDVAVDEATARGVAVANVVGSSNRAVAEHTLALMFDVARHLTTQDRAIRGGEWRATQGFELGGRTLGIVGLSAIAQELVPLAKGLGMRVLSWSRDNDPARASAVGAEATELADLLSRSDVVSLHVRLHPQLAGFFGRDKFAAMKAGAILINTARGELIDDAAMVEALQSGRLAGAGLDVFHRQPLPTDHPLRSAPNVVMTPVAGWNTVEASARLIRSAVDNVVAFVEGNPINVVNRTSLGR